MASDPIEVGGYVAVKLADVYTETPAYFAGDFWQAVAVKTQKEQAGLGPHTVAKVLDMATVDALDHWFVRAAAKAVTFFQKI